jgi:hypothetical protein
MYYYFLMISYALSIWMILDAWKRGAPMWWIVIIFIPLGEWVYFLAVKLPESGVLSNGSGFSGLFRSRTPLKCRHCRFMIDSDEDGVVCGKTGTRTFRTPVQVSYCRDFEGR